MTDRKTVEDWLAGYLRAWASNRPADIEALFTPDAIYRPTPHSEGWRGRDAIVAGWLERRDEPGTWSFEHSILAVDGDVAVVQGRTVYTDPPLDYSNLWILRLEPDGRCREYVEWWIERKARRIPASRPAPDVARRAARRQGARRATSSRYAWIDGTARSIRSK